MFVCETGLKPLCILFYGLPLIFLAPFYKNPHSYFSESGEIRSSMQENMLGDIFRATKKIVTLLKNLKWQRINQLTTQELGQLKAVRKPSTPKLDCGLSVIHKQDFLWK